MIEKESDDRTRSIPPRRNRESSSLVVGKRIHISPVLHEQFGFFQVVNGPHERGRACVIFDVGIGADFEKCAHIAGIPVQRGIHQSSGAARSFELSNFGEFAKHSLEDRTITGAHGFHGMEQFVEVGGFGTVSSGCRRKCC